MDNPFDHLNQRLRKIEEIILEISESVSNISIPESQTTILTVDDLSCLLKISKSSVYSKVSNLEIPFHKKGKRLYFIRSEIMEYLKSDLDNDRIKGK
ncbi:helix-turn-helix domain-containing protein [bacterium]|nr:helix-turn-helix domain-containing protein [bacterium]